MAEILEEKFIAPESNFPSCEETGSEEATQKGDTAVHVVLHEEKLEDTQQVPVVIADQLPTQNTGETNLLAPEEQTSPIKNGKSVSDTLNILYKSFAILLMLGAIAVFGFFYILPELTSDEVAVDSYVGMELEEVEEIAEESGWDLQIDQVRKDGSDEGDIVGQNPQAGEKLKKNGTLIIDISLGQEMVSIDIDNFVGLKYSDAVTQLEDMGFEVGTRTDVYNFEVAEDRVIDLSVDGKKMLDQYESGTVVDLLVSKGVEMVTVPKVNDEDEIKSKLTDQGFKVEKITEDSFRTKGKVLEMSPKAGTKVEKGSEVKITVSSGISGFFDDEESMEDDDGDQAVDLFEMFGEEVFAATSNNAPITASNRLGLIGMTLAEARVVLNGQKHTVMVKDRDCSKPNSIPCKTQPNKIGQVGWSSPGRYPIITVFK